MGYIFGTGSGSVSGGGDNSSGWALAGNAATGADFLGSTNNIPLIFKTNNVQRATIYGNGNIGFGIAVPLSKLHLFSALANVLNIDGSFNPGIFFSNNGVVKSYIGQVTVFGNYFSQTQPGDFAIRSNYNKVHIGVTLFEVPEPLSSVIPTMTVASPTQVGITNISPDASASLDIFSTTKGLLIPRMSTAQRDLIPSPAVSLLIYNLNAARYEYWNGTAWGSVGGEAKLQQTLSGDGTIAVAAGTYIPNISIKCATDSYLINIGITPGGIEIAEEEITAGLTRDILINQTFDVATTLYFTGIPAATTIIIYKK